MWFGTTAEIIYVETKLCVQESYFSVLQFIDSLKEFAQALEETLPGPAEENAPEWWEHFKNAVHNTALSTFGKKTKKMADWFEAHSDELMPAIKDKRRSLAAYKACLSEYNL